MKVDHQHLLSVVQTLNDNYNITAEVTEQLMYILHKDEGTLIKTKEPINFDSAITSGTIEIGNLDKVEWKIGEGLPAKEEEHADLLVIKAAMHLKKEDHAALQKHYASLYPHREVIVIDAAIDYVDTVLVSKAGYKYIDQIRGI